MLESIFSFICHQVPERTLTIGGHLLPLCARCTGIYSGFLIGLVFQIIVRRQVKRLPSLAISAMSTVFIVALIIDGVGERLQLWQIGNQVRFLIGLFCGSSLSIILFPLFNYFLHENHIQVSSIGSRNYTGLLVLVCLLFGLHYVSGSFSLFSFISIAGVLSIYLMANMTLVGIILNRKGMRWGYRNAFVMTGLILVLLLGEAMILGTIR